MATLGSMSNCAMSLMRNMVRCSTNRGARPWPRYHGRQLFARRCEATKSATSAQTRITPWRSNAFDNRTNRTIAGNGTTEAASGRFNGDMLSGRVEPGFKRAFNGFAVRPFAAVQFAELRQSGYSEASTMVTGGRPGLKLRVAQRVVAGDLPRRPVRQPRGIRQRHGVVALRAGVVGARVRPGAQHHSSFISLPGAGFTVDGPRAARDAARIAGSKIAISRNTAVFASFDGEFSKSQPEVCRQGRIAGETW